jgi:hypothetical protein
VATNIAAVYTVQPLVSCVYLTVNFRLRLFLGASGYVDAILELDYGVHRVNLALISHIH